MLDYGMDPQAAIDGPRCFSGSEGFEIETGYAPQVRAKLAAMGHDMVDADGPIGGAQAILMDDSGVLQGASDPRKDGCALGY
jgi:gamma-glutamyltranspeptidase/glutathione hydrolase